MTRSIALAALACLALTACKQDNSGQSRETKQSLQLSEQASIAVGVPAIKNFAEKRQLKMIYELRDTAELVTYTYSIDMNGRRHKVCPSTSVGYGIPYSTQFTAPKAVRAVKPIYPDGTQYATGDWKDVETDQPEPNGLYMPADASATWVLCLDPKTKQLAPTYVEPQIAVYLFEMPAVD